ncbi:hypothetical protein BY996DRAFT_4582863, partial [Phakopsora pachyrhizi]
DRRKRECQVNRIESIREENLKRKEEIFTQAWKELNDTQNALISNPPTEINYLLLLHRESLKRENQLLSIKLYHDHQIESARSAYEAEMQKILEDFSNAKNQAREKLLESLEERKRKIKEEKELIDFNEDYYSIGGLNHRSHHVTRGLRNRNHQNDRAGASNQITIFNRLSPIPDPIFQSTDPNQPNLDPSSTIDPNNNHQNHPHPLNFVTADDPLSMAALNVNPHLRQSPIFQHLLQFSQPFSSSNKRSNSRKPPVGLPAPISSTVITPGTWNNFHKSHLGISAAKIDDAESDLEQIIKSTNCLISNGNSNNSSSSTIRVSGSGVGGTSGSKKRKLTQNLKF